MFNSSVPQDKEENVDSPNFAAIEDSELEYNSEFSVQEQDLSALKRKDEENDLLPESASKNSAKLEYAEREKAKNSYTSDFDVDNKKASPSFKLINYSSLDISDELRNREDSDSDQVSFKPVDFESDFTSEENPILEVESDSDQVGFTSTRDYAQSTEEWPKLVPMIFHKIGIYWLAYGLAILACVLCLLKVYQVQETRDLTARYNEVQLNNDTLEKEWLNLVATRQNLSENAKVREYAVSRLQMVSPKTENEKVISLH